MSRTIDEKVVEMQFDNQNFEKNVKTSMTTLEKLKQSLKFSGAEKGIENISNSVKKVDMTGLGKAIETVQMKFSSLDVIAITALSNITNAALNAGKKIASALTIDPIKTGFQEYETQLNAVQTILANTSHSGTDIEDVNAALDELNKYADQTIYNFTEMTRNIGTFTAAGVDLDKSVTSIKGIANLAAISGSSAQQASTAMYQLSQALAAGRVSLMDWNSVVNAGMGGKVFQDALKRTAENFGYNVDEMISKYGSFRESLTQGGWLTAEVLTETLTQLSGAYTEADLIAQGYSESQAKEILELANTAVDAATKVKTFTQLVDTVKEAVQSGWAQSWEIIIGDFEEAKEFFTEVSNILGSTIEKMSNARNEVLQGWKDLGGRTDLIDSVRNSFEALVKVINPIREAFREVFPPTTAEQLFSFTKGLKNFTERLKISKEASEDLKDTFKGLFSILDIGRKIVISVAKPFINLLGGDSVSSLSSSLLDLSASFGRFFTKLNAGIDEGNVFYSISKTISSGLDFVSSSISRVLNSFGNSGNIFSNIFNVVSTAFNKIKNVIESALNWIRENISAGDIFAGLAGGGIFLFVKKLGDLADKIKDVFDSFIGKGGESASKFSDILNSLHDSLDSFQQGIRVASLVGIAIAIATLTSSLKTISEIKPEKVAYSLISISIMIKILNSGFKTLSKTLSEFSSKGTLKASVSMIAIATSINILASAMTKLSDLSFSEIVKGLVTIGVAIVELSAAIRIIGNTKVSLKTSVSIIAIAQACSMLSDSLSKFGSMSWEEIAKGLSAMGGALLEFSIVLSIFNKFSGSGALLGSISLLIASKSLDELSENLERLGDLSWDEIGRGLTSMGSALLEFTIVLSILSKIGGGGAVLGGVSLLIASKSLDEISENLKRLGNLSWGEIGRGLSSMGGALLELGAVIGILGKFTGFSGIFGAGAILIGVQGLEKLADALQKFGSMSWGEIGRGLSAMGGALLELGIISGLLGTLSPIGALVGSGSLYLAIQGLDDLANALQKFGSMSWDEIGRGLTAMGAAMGETALGGLLNTFSGFGANAISTIAKPLGDLADSVKKWENVTVPDNLGSELGSLAMGILSFTFSGLGAGAISEIAYPLGVMADSIKKWIGVTIPPNLGSSIGSLAEGVMSFTFGGLGAGALSEASYGIGAMADSIKKWIGVSVPEDLEDGLVGLANGVKAFSFAFVGGWSISSIIDPLDRLSESVKKWNGTYIPNNIQTELESLAKGVSAFNFSFFSGWSIDSVVEPLGNLAESVKKWNDVSISNVASDLEKFANSLKAFSDLNIYGFSEMSYTIPQAISNVMNSITSSVNANKLQVVSAFGSVIVGISNEINAKKSLVIFSFNTMLVSMITSANLKLANFKMVGQTIITYFVLGVREKEALAISAFTLLINKSIDGIRSKYFDFYNAGAYLVDGFANGISENTYKAEAKAIAMARAASEGARRELDEHSPSKVGYEIGDYFGIAFVTAISDYADKAYKASSEIAGQAKNGLSNAISSIVDLVNLKVDTEPVIRPVLDLTNVENGANKLNTIFARKQVSSISASMNGLKDFGNQNGISDSNRSIVFDFTQNNYSPKSLSRTDIYRQTNNQISAFERRIKAK